MAITMCGTTAAQGDAIRFAGSFANQMKVNVRLEQTGMRWTVEGAQAMLHTRTLYLNGDWTAFLTHRIQQEQARLYPEKTNLTP